MSNAAAPETGAETSRNGLAAYIGGDRRLLGLHADRRRAKRMLVLLHFHTLGFSPIQLAYGSSSSMS